MTDTRSRGAHRRGHPRPSGTGSPGTRFRGRAGAAGVVLVLVVTSLMVTAVGRPGLISAQVRDVAAGLGLGERPVDPVPTAPMDASTDGPGVGAETTAATSVAAPALELVPAAPAPRAAPVRQPTTEAPPPPPTQEPEPEPEQEPLPASESDTVPTSVEPSATDPAIPAPADESDAFSLRLVELVNAERATVGADPLTLDACATEFAESLSRTLAGTAGELEHQDLAPILRRCDADGAGENIAYNVDGSAESLMDQWMHSDGHRRNILNPEFTHIGVAVVSEPGGRWYGTQDFLTR